MKCNANTVPPKGAVIPVLADNRPALATSADGRLPPPNGDRWLTASEAAIYLGVMVCTLRKWRIRGVGPRYSASLGRDPRYRLRDLDDFMEQGLVEHTAQAKRFRKARRDGRGAASMTDFAGESV